MRILILYKTITSEHGGTWHGYIEEVSAMLESGRRRETPHHTAEYPSETVGEMSGGEHPAGEHGDCAGRRECTPTERQ